MHELGCTPDVLDVLVKDAQIHHAEEHGQIIVNDDEAGKVVEIEILPGCQ